MRPTAATAASTTLPPTLTVKSSILAANTRCSPPTEVTCGTPTFHRHFLTVNAEPSSPPTPVKKDSERAVSFKPPTATSSQCRGFPTSEATSNWTNSMPFSTMRQRASGSGATTVSRNPSTTAPGRLRSSAPSVHLLAMANGPASWCRIFGTKPKTPVDRSAWTV